MAEEGGDAGESRWSSNHRNKIVEQLPGLATSYNNRFPCGQSTMRISAVRSDFSREPPKVAVHRICLLTVAGIKLLPVESVPWTFHEKFPDGVSFAFNPDLHDVIPLLNFHHFLAFAQRLHRVMTRRIIALSNDARLNCGSLRHERSRTEGGSKIHMTGSAMFVQ